MTGRPIRVETTNGSASPFPDINPGGTGDGCKGDPIVLRFTPGDPGHFESSGEGGERNDCMIKAVQAELGEGVKLTRDQIADHIEGESTLYACTKNVLIDLLGIKAISHPFFRF